MSSMPHRMHVQVIELLKIPADFSPTTTLMRVCRELARQSASGVRHHPFETLPPGTDSAALAQAVFFFFSREYFTNRSRADFI